SVLAALFSILLIAAIAALVYTHILVRRQIAQFSLTIGGVGVKLDSQIAELKSLIGTIHGDRIEKAAATILEAIPRLTQFAIRAEKTVTAFENSLRIILGQQGGQQEISEDAIRRARQSGLGPDSYAPPPPTNTSSAGPKPQPNPRSRSNARPDRIQPVQLTEPSTEPLTTSTPTPSTRSTISTTTDDRVDDRIADQSHNESSSVSATLRRLSTRREQTVWALARAGEQPERIAAKFKI